MGGREVFWVRLPWGTYVCRPGFLGREIVGAAVIIIMLASALHHVREASRGEVPVIVEDYGAPLSVPSASPDPLSILFRLDRQPRSSFVLLSTVLGPTPRATLSVDGITYSVAAGDTVAGAVVDSIGRRVLVLRSRGEVFRVAL